MSRIPKADLKALLADTDTLKSILTYHVVPGKVLADTVKTMGGKRVINYYYYYYYYYYYF